MGKKTREMPSAEEDDIMDTIQCFIEKDSLISIGTEKKGKCPPEKDQTPRTQNK